MKIAFVIRRALIDAGVVRQNGTSSGRFTQADMLAWANDAQNLIEAAWRKSGKDYNLVTRESDDGSFTFENTTYNNSSYQLLSTTRTYTLPPDLITLKRIRAITSTYREYIFTPLDVNHPVFRSLEDADNPGGSEVYWDVIGRRTLRISHPMPATCDIEVMYNARLPKLYIYTVSGIQASWTIDDATITIESGALFIDQRLTLPAEIIFNSALGDANPVTMSQTSTDDFVVPSARTGTNQGWPIDSFTDDVTLELAATMPLATETSIGWLVASAPQYLEDHSHLVIKYLVSKVKSEIGDTKGAQEAMAEFRAEMKAFDYDIARRA